MKQAAAAAASSSPNERGGYYGEPTLGIPTTLRVQRELYGYPSDVQFRKQFPTRWSTTLFQCCTDPSTCLLTCCCPCVAFGQIAEIVDRGETSCIIGTGLYEVIRCLTGCACLYSAFFRAKMRAQYRLPESPAPDWAVHLLCEPCALAQEYRELKRRGYDMTIGWKGNLATQRVPPTMPPVVLPPMTRK
ncbi:protein PLANT CADMIUM RESISTANCE 2-like [Nymphaea colorata]|nr:protein PLANT CADMIUM RESISTANCE 2-like [Nymphaea colorata]